MNKQQLHILERAFEAEVNGALNHGTQVMQTRSKIAKQLVAGGLLEVISEKFGPVIVEGYGLTDAGRMLYCMSCARLEASNHEPR